MKRVGDIQPRTLKLLSARGTQEDRDMLIELCKDYGLSKADLVRKLIKEAYDKKVG